MAVRAKAIKSRVEADDAKERGSGVERKTTWGDAYTVGREEDYPPWDPVVPEGDDWVMEGSAADDGKLYWFWVRWP